MWTKDEISEAPKVIYTPAAGDTSPAVTRLVYDPDAPAGRRYSAEMSGISATNQTQADAEAVLGIT